MRTTYADAFAGTGRRAAARPERAAECSLFENAEAHPEAGSFKEGSARAALEVEPSFDS